MLYTIGLRIKTDFFWSLIQANPEKYWLKTSEGHFDKHQIT